MSKFKAGDKVRRVTASELNNWFGQLCITNGYSPTSVFEVSSPDEGDFINLKEFAQNISFDSERFELVTLPEKLWLQHAPWCNWITSKQMTKCSCSPHQQLSSDDGIKQPNHYMLFDDVEAIEIIACSMTLEQFKGYILGSVLKYRLRAGKKSEMATMEKDLAKAAQFAELFEKHKGLCHA